MEDDKNKCKGILYSWTGRININMTKGLKTICRFQWNHYQNAKGIFFFFFTEPEKKNPKFVWKHKDIEQIIIINLRKNKVGVIILPDLKLFYKPTVFKTVWY